MRDAIQQLVGAILNRHPRKRYGSWEDVQEIIKREIRQLVISMSQPTGNIDLATLLAQTVHKIFVPRRNTKHGKGGVRQESHRNMEYGEMCAAPDRK